jgi:hypothetical protein
MMTESWKEIPTFISLSQVMVIYYLKVESFDVFNNNSMKIYQRLEFSGKKGGVKIYSMAPISPEKSPNLLLSLHL